MILRLAIKSLWSRKATLAMTLLAIVTSIALLMAINHIKQQAKTNFSRTIKGTDLIVGARSSSINLLLYSVFHIGNATNNIQWKTFLELQKHRDVEWLIPISLGDSHKGFRVVGTQQDFFTHYAFSNQQQLRFTQGHAFASHQELVLGSEVAKNLGYSLTDSVVLAHGTSEVNLYQHTNHPFTVVGILEPTGTPLDKSLLVSLEAIEAIHLNWQAGIPLGSTQTLSSTDQLTPKNITAILVGLKSKQQTFKVQRQVNQYKTEALTAIMPGVALGELWHMLSAFETLLTLVALMVLIASIISLCSCLLAELNERKKEMAILRSLGASPLYLFCLIELEILFLTITGFILALALLTGGFWAAQDFLLHYFAVQIDWSIWHSIDINSLLLMFAITLSLGLIPATVNARIHLHKGLSE